MRSEPDHYSQKARKEGYAARSVYKLQEINRKSRVIKQGSVVLDIGAAPGSWSQYASSVSGPKGVVVAVDLSEMPTLERFENVHSICGDIYDESVLTSIRDHGPFDAVISDAAPRTTGNRTVDTARSSALVEHVITLCPQLLKPGGGIVAKLFQGGDEKALLEALRASFDTARIIKPRASRSESFEVFLVGTGYTSEI